MPAVTRLTPGLASEVVERLVAALETHRDPVRAAAMSAYMRHLFPFLGIPTPARRAMTHQAIAGLPRPDQSGLASIAGALWMLDEREYQYAACDLLSRYQAVCAADFLPVARHLITTRSWWDTVDGIASGVVGPLVSRHHDLTAEMDRWIESDNTWLARTALLHQLRYKGATDATRLFRYCEIRAKDDQFFIRKAIGWALREYSKTDPQAVRQFVAYATGLSTLSRREALLWLEGGRRRERAQPAGS